MKNKSLKFESDYNRNRLIIQFMIEKDPDFTAGPEILDILDQVYQSKNTVGMRHMVKDIKEFITILPQSQQLLLAEKQKESGLFD